MTPLLIAGVVLLAAGVMGRTPPDLRRFEAVEPHMGTLVQVTVYTAGEREAQAAFRAAFDRIHELDRILSDYRADSELNALARTAVSRPVAVGDDLFAVLRASQDLAEATGGAFDVTQGPVIRLWRDARQNQRVPEAAALRDAAHRSGYRKLRLDTARRTAMLEMPGMALDVGAIGKGYAASEAVETLRRRGVTRALVAVSGDIAFGDAPPGQRGWRIAIHGQDPSLVGAPRVLELTNAAVSTSGSSGQHLDAGGRRYSHIIDPSSGMALTEDLTVTVVARHGVDADGLDTAISVLGRDRGLALVESHPHAAALLVSRTSAGATGLPSSRFRELVAKYR